MESFTSTINTVHRKVVHLVTAGIIATLSLTYPVTGTTQNQKAADPIVITHLAPRAQDLPPPGYPLDLVVTLKNTKDIDRKLRAFLVRDGQLINITLDNAKYTQREEPYYKISLVAPLGELVYQFLLFNADGSYTVSERYVVRRNCLPQTTPAPQNIDEKIQGEQRLYALDTVAKALDRDIARYQTSFGLLQQLKTMLSE